MAGERPKAIVKAIGKEFPNLWKEARGMQERKGKSLPYWDDWCYLPIAAGVNTIIKSGHATAEEIDAATYRPKNAIEHPAVLVAAATWRVSQGVYRFDETLFNSITSQPLDGGIPVEVLKRLPEWCVYIETTGCGVDGDSLEGFWAHLEHDVNSGGAELRLVLMTDKATIPFPIPLGGTLCDGFSRLLAKLGGNEWAEADFIKEVSPLVQLVLYLCADNADMPKRPVHPSRRARAMGAIDAPKEPRVWEVGERIGARIRAYPQSEQREGSSGGGTGKRPHIRRAHWHHYRTGKGRTDVILKWLPPIPIGDVEDGPTVVHRVDTTTVVNRVDMTRKGKINEI